MTPPPEIGKTKYKQGLAEIRLANRTILKNTEEILELNPGPLERSVLLNRITLAAGKSLEAVHKLEMIVENDKNANSTKKTE